MNLSVSTQAPYSSYYASRQAGGRRTYPGQGTNGIAAALSPFIEQNQKEAGNGNEKMRQLLRGLKQNQNPYLPSQDNQGSSLSSLYGKTESKKEDKVKKPVRYNYKEIAAKILKAKNSLSAGQAYLSAKRKVLEIRRKISNADGDAEELQLALTHAKRMEMVARKKKHHLELEELVTMTEKRDEKQSEMEEASAEMKDAIIEEAEDEVAKEEDAIFEEREDMLEEATEELQEEGQDSSEELLSSLNEMIADFGEEELKELEEAMEMLEDMEMLDPHMSEEELDELKRKHRAAEQKAIMKADMDYLKDLIKHQVSQGGGIPGMSGGNAAAGFSTPIPQGIDASISGAVALDIGL